MSTDNTNDDDELTVESLTKSKSDIFSEHGLENTTLGKAVAEKEAQELAEAAKRQSIVEKKVLLAQAEQRGLGDDPDVEALRADIHDMSADLEAEALRAQHAEELEEARAKIDNLEGLAQRASSQNQDKLARNYTKRAEALKSQFPELADDEPGKFSAEALGLKDDDKAAEKEKEAAEALADFRERQSVKELEEQMDPSDKKLLSNFKTLKSQATGEKTREMYEKKIEKLRAKYAE